MSQQLIDAYEAACRLDVHPKTFARFVRAGLIAPAVPGRKGRGAKALFHCEDVERLRALRKNGPDPAPVDSPVSPDREQRIEAGLRRAHGCPIHPGECPPSCTEKVDQPDKWLDDVADRWLAQAAKADHAQVDGSAKRHPHRRERDLHDHRVDHGKDADKITFIPFQHLPEFGIDVRDDDDEGE